MNRKDRNFHSRRTEEQAHLTKDTWCNFCNEADLGMDNPIEYQQDNKIYLEGICRKCGNRIVAEIITKEIVK